MVVKYNNKLLKKLNKPEAHVSDEHQLKAL